MDNNIDDLLNLTASEIVNNVLDRCQRNVTCASQEDSKQPGFQIRNIDWVACKDFTISIGKTQIEEYVGTWEVDPKWLFTVQFLQESEMEYEKQFTYRVLWSIPTSRFPIPKCTAAVYFTIIISKIKPHTSPVLVRFQVESSESVHTPGQTRFREKWLMDVIESKALLMKTVTF